MSLVSEKQLLTVLLGVFSGLPAVSIDLSAPTLTLLPHVLGTTVFMAGLTLSLFMVGFGFGQFLGGRLSDLFGRRPVLIGGLAIYSLSGVCCMLATSGEALVVARCCQGLGAGSCAVQAIAIVTDVYRGETARRQQSYVTAIMTVMPMLAPAVGAIMVEYSNWRSVHAVLAVGGVGLLAIVGSWLRETRPADLACAAGGLGLQAAASLLRQRWFVRIVATNSFSYGAIFCYIAGTPVVLMGPLGYSDYTYAALFASTALALTSGSYSSAGLGRAVGGNAQRLIGPALLAQTAAYLVLLLPNPFNPVLQALVIWPGLLVSCFARGVIAPNMVHIAIASQRENAGLAAAVMGFSQLLTGAISGAIVAALLPRLGYLAVAATMAVFAVISICIWTVTRRATPMAC